MSSPYIEGSKHTEMTAAVEAHFDGPQKFRTKAGDASGKGFNKGGDAQYNNVPMDWSASDASGGLNYMTPGHAGHTTGGLPAGVKPKNTA